MGESFVLGSVGLSTRASDDLGKIAPPFTPFRYVLALPQVTITHVQHNALEFNHRGERFHIAVDKDTVVCPRKQV